MNDDTNSILDALGGEHSSKVRTRLEITINRVLIAVTAICLSARLVFTLMTYTNVSMSWYKIELVLWVAFVSQVGIIGLLYWNGTLIKRKVYRNLISFFFCCFILIWIFRIMHLVNVFEFLIFWPFATMVVYIIHFATKPNKVLLDYLKVIWVIFVLAISFGPVADYFSIPTESTTFSIVFEVFIFGVFALDYLKQTSTEKHAIEPNR